MPAQLFQAGAGLDRVGDLLAIPVSVADASDGAVLPRITHAITMRHVGFAYPGRGGATRPVLDDSGRTVGGSVVGPSGAGKSTILNLLLRFRTTPPADP